MTDINQFFKYRYQQNYWLINRCPQSIITEHVTVEKSDEHSVSHLIAIAVLYVKRMLARLYQTVYIYRFPT